MKRNLLIILLAACALLLAACNDQDAQKAQQAPQEQPKPAPAAPQTPKIGIVDAEQVFQRSKLAGDGMAFIEEQSNLLNHKLFEMQKQVEAEPENQDLSLKLQGELTQLQQQFEADQREAAEKINVVFNEVVEEYRKAHNLEIVLPVQIVIASRPGANITDKIVELMDKKTIDFFEGKERLPKPEEQNSGGAPAQPGDDPASGQPEDAPAPGTPGGEAETS